jgi:plastocyanin
MRFRSGLLAVVLPCLVIALAPSSASAQDNSGSCRLTGSKGTKQDYTCRMGPVTVAPFQVLTKELIFSVPKPDVDGFVTKMSVDVVDANGKQVPISRLMLHHIVFINIGKQLGSKRDPTCGGTFEAWNTMSTLPNWGERFYAAGEERARMQLPEGYGYPPGGKRDGSTHKRKMFWNVPKGGRLIAAGGHVHGGGQALKLRRPACPNKSIYTSRPIWGTRKHPFYNVRPVLHEPGPIHMTGFYSARGVPLARGEKVVLEADYDDSQPHTRVMGIMVVFVAPDSSVTQKCGARPNDFVELRKPKGRKSPPPFRVPIVGRRGGRAVNISAPRGKRVSLGRGGTVEVGDLFFKRPNISLRAGGTVTWHFNGPTIHNITLANGPRGFSSKNLSNGRTFKKKLSVPGTYQLFCGLHPVDMTATIKVKGRRE